MAGTTVAGTTVAGTVVEWLLGAALATVAFLAGWRLVRWRRIGAVVSSRQLVDSGMHLVMALGTAAMLASGGVASAAVLRWGFGGVAVGLAVAGLAAAPRAVSSGGHRLHHAAMAGVMAVMAGAPHGMASAMGPGMAMAASPAQSAGRGPSVVMLAAFGYVCVAALVVAWRAPVLAHGGAARRHGAIDPYGRACEIIMFVSSAVMLLPMI